MHWTLLELGHSLQWVYSLYFDLDEGGDQKDETYMGLF